MPRVGDFGNFSMMPVTWDKFEEAPPPLPSSFIDAVASGLGLSSLALEEQELPLKDEHYSSALSPRKSIGHDFAMALQTPAPTLVYKCPPGAPRLSSPEPLLAAIMNNAVDEVHEACLDDADAAVLPFFEHDVEPPLCAAIRLGCGSDVVSALLNYGADAKLTDIHGRDPLAILMGLGSRRPAGVEALLREAGPVAPVQPMFVQGGPAQSLDNPFSAFSDVGFGSQPPWLLHANELVNFNAMPDLPFLNPSPSLSIEVSNMFQSDFFSSAPSVLEASAC